MLNEKMNFKISNVSWSWLQFDPELILVSAGYDAALGCPEVGHKMIIAVLADPLHE